MNNELFALISKALSDPNRLQIIQMITDQERCACKLLEHFNISQPTLSHHMRILSDCNLIKTRKEGKWSHYSMNMETMEATIPPSTCFTRQHWYQQPRDAIVYSRIPQQPIAQNELVI
jgi:ArsR family transcriptional regulator